MKEKNYKQSLIIKFSMSFFVMTFLACFFYPISYADPDMRRFSVYTETTKTTKSGVTYETVNTGMIIPYNKNGTTINGTVGQGDSAVNVGVSFVPVKKSDDSNLYKMTCQVGDENKVVNNGTFWLEDNGYRTYIGTTADIMEIRETQDGDPNGFVLNIGNNDNVKGQNIYFTYVDEKGVEHEIALGEIGAKNGILYSSAQVNGDRGFWATVFGWLTDHAGEVMRLLEEIVVDLSLGLVDAIHYIICRSVGEFVTIDRILFNKVGKVSIDFWDNSDAASAGNTSIKSVMKGVVNKWYRLFYGISIIIYMVSLVFVGIQILLNSTAEKKAKYKDVLMSWVTGIAILTLFPYVMKYTVQINNIAILAMENYVNPSGNKDARNYVPGILSASISDVASKFGSYEYVKSMIEGTGGGNTVKVDEIKDTSMRVRVQAGMLKRIVLVGVYFILLGEVIVLLFMYYKRVFMLAFLIVIFPLVAATFVIDKIGDKKAQSFGIWYKEFAINVFVQLFHVAIYVALVEPSISTYLAGNDKTWLFMILSIVFLFQGEKIIRGIFNAKSAANTIGDLAMVGAGIYGAKKIFERGGKSSGSTSKGDAAAMDNIKDRNETNKTVGAGGTSGSGGAGNTNAPPRPSSTSQDNDNFDAEHQGRYTGNDPDGVDTEGGKRESAKDKVMRNALRKRIGSGTAAKALTNIGSATGKLMGAAAGMARGETSEGSVLSNMASGAYTGSAIGGAVGEGLGAAADKIEQKVHGEKLYKDIANGNQDNALNLDAGGGIVPADVDPNEIIGKHGETVQELYRKALAEMARAASSKGAASGEVAFWNYIEENTKTD